MYKLIAVDVDGTLLNSKKEITPRTLSALIAVQQKGVKLVIATGRAPYGVRKVAEQLRLGEFGGFIMGCNGARVVEASDLSRPLLDISVPAEHIPEVCEFIKGSQAGISTYEGNMIIAGNWLTDQIIRNAQMLSMPYRFVENFGEYVNFPVNKCLISGEPELIFKLEKELSERFARRLSIFRSEEFLLEIVAPGVNKGAALKFLTERLKIERKECMAFGDNANDTAMIEYAGTGIAMVNALTEVKKAADVIADSNDNDGVAKIIESFCL